MDNINELNATKTLVDRYGAQKVIAYYVSRASIAASSCGSAVSQNNPSLMALRLGEIQASLDALKHIVNDKDNISTIDNIAST